MNPPFKNITLYWKCQLIGWTVFLMVVTIFNELVYHDTRKFLPFAVSIYMIGLLFSHLFKLAIKKLRILNKKFSTQVFSLSALSVLFSVLGTFTWMLIMINLGYWKLNANTRPELITAFFHGFFFHLFLSLLTFSGWVLIYFLFHYVKGVRKEEQLKTLYQLQMIEIEAKALRAQMMPHFIFNCLNSIKTLMLEQQTEKGIIYLTTFSKLIRTLFNNSDKKEISLYDEMETCKYYLQLEEMRFNTGFSYQIIVDEQIDLKSIHIPALFIQPFIENAIWHGIMPKKTPGTLKLEIKREEDHLVKIIIDDNGIGREASQRNKSTGIQTHNSRGVTLTLSRLELDNLLYNSNMQIETVDKKNEQNEAVGTKVTITINIKES